MRMGRQHLREVRAPGPIRNVISITQQKTGTPVAVPVHPELQQLLDRLPRTAGLGFLFAHGKPFGQSAYNAWWRAWVSEAGLSAECRPHGLRKAAARRLAELGCTAHQIMAILGHKSLSEGDRYTRDADRERLAREAMSIYAAGSKPERKLSRRE
jgi:integrase